jgi:uncharacterized protein (TIGR02246 family)
MELDEQAIRDLIATWLAASKAGDTKTVLSLMADDVVFLVPGQPPMRGKSAFAAAQGALNDLDIDATSEIQEIEVSGDWAYSWTKLTVVRHASQGRRFGQALRPYLVRPQEAERGVGALPRCQFAIGRSGLGPPERNAKGQRNAQSRRHQGRAGRTTGIARARPGHHRSRSEGGVRRAGSVS